MMIPGSLAVVMGVHVDEAGGDDAAGGVDFALSGAVNVGSQFDNTAVLDGHVQPRRRGPATVDHFAIADQQVVVSHRCSPSSLRGGTRAGHRAGRSDPGRYLVEWYAFVGPHVLRQPQHPFGDDVAQNLVGAALDAHRW